MKSQYVTVVLTRVQAKAIVSIVEPMTPSDLPDDTERFYHVVEAAMERFHTALESTPDAKVTV
ncbi:MAG: hypothetical protein NVSMB21_25630 [Vulcanimicrobiaceae bacterium]